MLKPVAAITPGVHRYGWRAQLWDNGRCVWRCDCGLPHRSPARARACSAAALSQRGSGFYPGRDYMDEWLPVPQSDEERIKFGDLLAGALRSEVPRTIDDAVTALHQLRASIMQDGAGFEDIREHQARAEYFKKLFSDIQEVRQLSELVLLSGEWRIALRLIEEPEAPGGQPYQAATRDRKSRVEHGPSLTELVGDRKYGWRLKQIAPLALEALESMIAELHRAGKEATLTGIVQLLRMQERSEEAAWRRLNSLTAPRIQSGMDLRIGDCRVVLSDVADNSIPLILTDPPYGNDAEPLYEWLARFAERVLIPGGSLICYTGNALVRRDYRIFDEHLSWHWTAIMLHDDAQRMFGPNVIVHHKPILWYVKDHRRGRSMVPDVVRSKRDKSEHDWAQGDGGVEQWIHMLTEPEETILDPFAGTAVWGRIACELGRRWIGADIVAGGTTDIMADEIGEAAE
jgi:hypothetical protein